MSRPPRSPASFYTPSHNYFIIISAYIIEACKCTFCTVLGNLSVVSVNKTKDSVSLYIRKCICNVASQRQPDKYPSCQCRYEFPAFALMAYKSSNICNSMIRKKTKCLVNLSVEYVSIFLDGCFDTALENSIILCSRISDMRMYSVYRLPAAIFLERGKLHGVKLWWSD